MKNTRHKHAHDNNIIIRPWVNQKVGAGEGRGGVNLLSIPEEEIIRATYHTI